MELIRFKQDDKHNLKEEFEKIDWRLRFIYMAWVAEVQYRFNYTPTVTEIFRTQEEQDYIYKVLATDEEKAKYALNPVTSTHQVGRAIDSRSNDMSQEIIDFTKEYMAHVMYDISRNIQTFVYHTVGAGWHFHFQCNGEGMTCVRSRSL